MLFDIELDIRALPCIGKEVVTWYICRDWTSCNTLCHWMRYFHYSWY